VLVAATRSTHLLSTWDAGVPPEIPAENLYGLTWNPAVMAASLAAIPGLAGARRLGVDALSPGFQRAAGRLAPAAELVPADDLLRRVRAVKLPGEVERIGAAVAVATAGMEAATAAVAAGSSSRRARAAALAALSARGATVPASGVLIQPPGPRGEPGAVDVGVLVDGYEGGLARPAGPAGIGAGAAVGHLGADDLQQRIIDRCRPGAAASDLRDAAAGSGTDPGSSTWMVRGCGMGFEPPVVTADVGDGAVVQAGMVLSVEVTVGRWRRRDLVHVGPGATRRF
jgi:Xaa-Pro aminopeptidase